MRFNKGKARAIQQKKIRTREGGNLEEWNHREQEVSVPEVAF